MLNPEVMKPLALCFGTFNSTQVWSSQNIPHGLVTGWKPHGCESLVATLVIGRDPNHLCRSSSGCTIAASQISRASFSSCQSWNGAVAYAIHCNGRGWRWMKWPCTWYEMEMTAWFFTTSSSPPPRPPETGSRKGRPTSSSTWRSLSYEKKTFD